MTLKDEFLIFWILFVVVITFAARHFLTGAVYLLEHIAVTSASCIPSLLHFTAGFGS
jgi:hypothetical protein